NTVRKNIKDFARQTIGKSDPNYPCPPYKYIILDEADSMTAEAQNALRKVIEKYSKITRFIFICNYISLIIEPIISRCAKFYFAPLQISQSLPRIKFISEKEGIKLTDKIYKRILELTEGDLR